MSSPAICRPISIVSKVLEQHISNIIMDHLEEVAPISSNQCSFMPGSSTTFAAGLLSITNSCLQALDMGHDVPYSQKIWRGIKFGGLTVLAWRNRQIKIRQNLYRVHVSMAILFQTAKFKSANTQFGGKPPNLKTANISG